MACPSLDALYVAEWLDGGPLPLAVESPEAVLACRLASIGAPAWPLSPHDPIAVVERALGRAAPLVALADAPDLVALADAPDLAVSRALVLSADVRARLAPRGRGASPRCCRRSVRLRGTVRVRRQDRRGDPRRAARPPRARDAVPDRRRPRLRPPGARRPRRPARSARRRHCQRGGDRGGPPVRGDRRPRARLAGRAGPIRGPGRRDARARHAGRRRCGHGRRAVHRGAGLRRVEEIRASYEEGAHARPSATLARGGSPRSPARSARTGAPLREALGD